MAGRRLIGGLCVAVVLAVPVQAQQRVGLVLSGGGAKGIAHAGVIKALEEEGIPIDYIAGTSIGALVGGFYAAGYSPEEIERLIGSQNLVDWVSGQVEPGYDFTLPTREPDPSWSSVQFRLDSSSFVPHLGLNLASDRVINFAFLEWLAKANQAAGYDFDSLLVPLRVVTSEVLTQQTIALDSGQLHHALRASMTIPFVYRPIKVNGMYLFDGGVYNNFPVDVMSREFSPDVLIGVNVASKRFADYPVEQAETLVKDHLLLMLINKGDTSMLSEGGVYIEPDVVDYSGTDFDQAQAIFERGYAAAQAAMPELRAAVSRRVGEEEMTRRRLAFKQKAAPYEFQNVATSGFTQAEARYIQRVFRPHPRKPYDLERMKRAYFRLVSEPYFRNVVPAMEYMPGQGSYQMVLDHEPAPPLRLSLGGLLSTRSISMLHLAADYDRFRKSLKTYHADIYAGEFYQSIGLDYKVQLPTRIQTIFKGYVRFSSMDYAASRDVVFEGQAAASVDQTQREFGLQNIIGVGRHNLFSTRVAYVSNTDKYSNAPGLNSLDTLDFQDLAGLKVSTEYYREYLDDKLFPTKGVRGFLRASYYLLEETYTPGSSSVLPLVERNRHNWLLFTAHLEQYFNTTKWLSLGYLVEAAYGEQATLSNYNGHLIYTPSFEPTFEASALFLQRFRSPRYAAGRGTIVTQFSPSFSLRLNGSVFLPFAKVLPDVDNSPNIVLDGPFEPVLAANAVLVYTNPLAPISLSVSSFGEEDHRFLVQLSLGYQIFGRDSIE